jgi:hypothetical protein
MNQQDLQTLLQLNVSAQACVITVYAPVTSNRLNYVCQFVFNHVLNCQYVITNSVEIYKVASFKINYSTSDFKDGLQIQTQGFLENKTELPLNPSISEVNGDKVIFLSPNTNQNYLLSFDVFSAVFFFISRYEEWQTTARDAHNRFEAEHSWLFKNNLLQTPIVDEWVYLLKAQLIKQFPSLSFPKKQFKYISTIDVDNLFAYQHKGIIRSVGGAFKDLIAGRFANVNERVNVLLKTKKDPFDIYDELSKHAVDTNYPLIYFFLFSNTTKYDRTVSPKNPIYKTIIKTVQQHQSLIGLHPSYDTDKNDLQLKQELNDWYAATNLKTTLSRQHYLRFDIKETPQLLIKNGILADFSMGFASQIGFRAGTSHPFHYFNFNTNQAETLLFVPFAWMDGYYFIYKSISAETLYTQVLNLAESVKKVNGLFISIAHERSFSDAIYKGFNATYKKLAIALKS